MIRRSASHRLTHRVSALYRQPIRPLLPVLLLLTTVAYAQVPARSTGMPTVTDGDTLQIRGTKIRLYGVDASESSQQCRQGGVLKSTLCGL